MTDTTFDELRRCPICHELGSSAGVDTMRDRSQLHKFQCENPNCRWFKGAPWLRQRRPDGSWVEAQRHSKQFPNIPDRTEEVQQMIDQDIKRSLGR